ncbi:RNA polymerase sigma-70 factor, ECF subfamily [Sphingobacterium nematocida]|uniref:RNA polymerase sigma-70 factor, ECF subfamily n=1 Tax=Sphingobacterium nematocida TaxID=1513896 RepID=A0A1T5GQF4_9SPHI|nr:sigma-70 family RNA polymerase sigma factor [Sphingobacterium nematocida]SKC10617.1 RNA polymerase sigma-70 factor, ECF subfamily [Sphingobacterium nematocida]
MNTPPDIDDSELLLRMRDGDQQAFNAIYHRYKSRIATKLFAVLKVDELVEDTLQELFFRVWEKRSSIDPEQNIAGYLYRIATNLALDHFRKLAREQRIAALQELPQGEGALHIYQEKLDQELFKLIDQLPEQRKRVFMLCKFENKSYEEVGQLLHISTHAVKDHVVKANKFLKNNYGKLAPWAGYCLAIYALSDFL